MGRSTGYSLRIRVSYPVGSGQSLGRKRVFVRFELKTYLVHTAQQIGIFVTF